MAFSTTAAAARTVDYFFELTSSSDLVLQTQHQFRFAAHYQLSTNTLFLSVSLVASMNSVRILLLFASTCLAQAQESASRNARDILPSITTTSTSILFPIIVDPIIPDQHDSSFPRADEPKCEPYDSEEARFEDLQRQADEAPTPFNWARVFHAQTNVTNATRRLGEMDAKVYKPEVCTKACNDVRGCIAINIYFELTPKSPFIKCPLGMTEIKCTLWGEPLSIANATDSGHEGPSWLRFAGSNAYHRGPPTESDEESDEESSASGRASMKITGLTVASVMALWVLGAMAESWF